MKHNNNVPFKDGDIIHIKGSHIYGVVGEFIETSLTGLDAVGEQAEGVLFSTLNTEDKFEVRVSPAGEAETIPFEGAEAIMTTDGLDRWCIFRIMNLARRYIALEAIRKESEGKS